MEQSPPTVNLDLLKRFDVPGPRYTSYPTAPIFSSDYTDKTFEIDLIRNNDRGPAPLSLYVHIPFCDTLCYFCGCTTMVTSSRERIAEYITLLKEEINRVSFYINKRRRVVQMHWGGGTPSYLTPEQISDLGAFFRSRFEFADNAEISIEIDPRGLTQEHIQAFRNIGTNRISIGVQDFNERIQRAVNRIQPEELTRQAMAWAGVAGIQNINLDLIYGLPLQSVASFEETLKKIVQLSPNRIAVFNFAYVPWMKLHQKLIHPEDLLSAETKLELIKMTIEQLTGAGYCYIGMDHFAKPQDDLTISQQEKTLHRNFQGYSTHAGADLFGFGMSSISHFGEVYAQNAKTIKEYAEAVKSGHFPVKLGYRMTRDDRIRKYVIMRLMCDLELEKSDVEQRFGILFDEYFDASLDRLDEFCDAGLVRHTIERITVADEGRLFLRNIAMCFDAYLEKLRKTTTFSRTV